MNRSVVCSVGTSAAKGICRPAELNAWVVQRGGPDKASADIYNSFRDAEPSGDALRDKLSAEIHSLVRIDLDQCSRVILLASATDDGHACALAVKRYLEDRWDHLQVKVSPVSGLQVTDPIRFKQEGAVEYCKACLEAVRSYGRENVVLNPTGGYKALVPYTVLVGMLKRVPCRYIFEQSSVLLDLPPLPVEFQRGLFEAHRTAFDRIEQATSIKKAEWESLIPYEDRESLAALFEVEGDEVTLSGVGFLFLDEVRAPAARVAFLSTSAWRDCLENLSRLANCDPFRFLERVARSDEALRAAEHVNAGNGLRWLKPGRTTDRYLVSVEEWRMLVWRAVREDEVGSDYPTRIQVDPSRERDRYAPFSRMELHC
jgi:putative CRISPR-associated protein (TIGR02619 family)